MHHILTSLSSMDIRGTELRDMFLARRRVFIEDLGWPLYSKHGLEWDQFDNLDSHYLIVLDNDDEVVAGVRFTPTARETVLGVTPMPYMIKEAAEGKLKDLPDDLLYIKPPYDLRIFEASRLFVSAQGKENKLRTHARLIVGMREASKKLGFDSLLAIADHNLSAKISMMGFPHQHIGRDFWCSGRGPYNAVRIEMG